jgi:hypothetical protein
MQGTVLADLHHYIGETSQSDDIVLIVLGHDSESVNTAKFLLNVQNAVCIPDLKTLYVQEGVREYLLTRICNSPSNTFRDIFMALRFSCGAEQILTETEAGIIPLFHSYVPSGY